MWEWVKWDYNELPVSFGFFTQIMKKCVLTEDYEKQVTIPTEKSRRAEKRERRVRLTTVHVYST